ncbi:MAG TPA: hypothetical protein VF658_04645 [Pyrinomonadaceae bacterium]
MKATRLALAAIIAHVAILSFHSAAHLILGVQASTLQNIFIVAVIIIAPPLSGVLLWKNLSKPGAALLACSMAGSLIFGVYNHYVGISPDHVSQVALMSPASWSVIFRITALFLALTEVLGTIAGIWILKRRLSDQSARAL